MREIRKGSFLRITGTNHALIGQRLDLLGRHPQHLAVHIIAVLAMAGRAAVEASADMDRTLVELVCQGQVWTARCAVCQARS
jgi:hypothetical protein